MNITPAHLNAMAHRLATLMVRLYGYDGCGAGGALHVVIEDGNVDYHPDDMVDWEFLYGLSLGAQCITFEIIGLLTPFDWDEREAMINQASGLIDAGVMRMGADPRMSYADGGPWTNGGEL